jgi:hypothetical protein
MSIAIPTYAAGSIATYNDLIDEIRDMMDDADYSLPAIDRAIRKAEAEFSRTLRTTDMETRTAFTISSELSPMPNDFIEMRFIFAEGAPDQPLASMSPAAMLSTYAGRTGRPMAYTIEGNMLRVGPVGTTAVEMVYYRRIPELTSGQVSNWLLQKHPDLYIAGVLYHLARRERDEAGMAQAAQEVSTLTAGIRDESLRARWGSAPLTPAGVRQVRGARI